MPSHPVYVNVQVLVPAHGGSALGTPAAGTTGFPQASITVGGVGNTARATQATVEDPFAGSVKDEARIVYVYTHGYAVPLQAV